MESPKAHLLEVSDICLSDVPLKDSLEAVECRVDLDLPVCVDARPVRVDAVLLVNDDNFRPNRVETLPTVRTDTHELCLSPRWVVPTAKLSGANSVRASALSAWTAQGARKNTERSMRRNGHAR